MRHLLVGLDGGGTKTDAVLCDGEGRVLRRAVGASSSPVSQTFTLASEHIRETLAKLLMGYEGFYAPLTGFFAGISGGGVGKNAQHFTSFFRELLPNTAHLRSGSDSINALSSGIGPGDGIVAIAGTGSSVFVRLDDTMHQVGGWGYLLGDECSGYELGHFALMGALRAYDGRGPATLLSKLCAQRLNGSVAEQIQRIYEGGRTFIASFAPCLFEAQMQGDEVAQTYMEQSVQGMYEALRVAGRMLPQQEKPVVTVGGVWRPDGWIETRLHELLDSNFRLIHPTLPPVYGAVLEAAKLAGCRVKEGFRENFARTI